VTGRRQLPPTEIVCARDSPSAAYLETLIGQSFVLAPDVKTAFTMIENGTSKATIWENYGTEYLTSSEYCGLRSLGDDFQPFGLGIAMPQASLVMDQLNVAILKLRLNGTLTSLGVDILNKHRKCDPPSAVDQALGVQTLAGLFVFWCSIIGVAIIVHAFDMRLRSGERNIVKMALRRQRDLKSRTAPIPANPKPTLFESTIAWVTRRS